MKKIKENYKKIFMYIGLFLILFYPFNISFKDYIYVNEYMNLAIQLLGITMVVIPSYKQIISNIKLSKKIICISIFASIIFIFFRNGDVINGHFGMPFYILEFFLILIIFSSSKEWRKIFARVFMIFIIEHIIGTWFCFIFRDFYYNNILVLFKDFSKELIYQFEHGQVAGFTQHYSTNATYLLQGIVFECYYLDFNIKKERKNIFNWIILILNFGAILLTGKRAQLFFGIISIMATFLIENRGKNIEIIKKWYKQIGIAAIFMILIVTCIPPFRGAITKTYDSLMNKDIFLTRKPMNDLAIEKFVESPVFGKGWGAYKYYYHNELINQERSYMDAHNIYLQLLSEIGIVGSVMFIGAIVIILRKILKAQKNVDIKDKRYIYILLAYQIYILLEGMIGNPIYDIPVLIPYGFFLAMFLNLIVETREIKKQ